MYDECHIRQGLRYDHAGPPARIFAMVCIKATRRRLAPGRGGAYLTAMIDELYSREILRRTTQLDHIGHLAEPQGVADRTAKLCGSTIHVEVNMDGDAVSEFAQQVKACALGQAAAAILSQHVVGASAGEIRAARDALRGLLKGEDVTFPGRFGDLQILKSVRDFPARHASTLLALEATCEAIDALQHDF